MPGKYVRLFLYGITESDFNEEEKDLISSHVESLVELEKFTFDLPQDGDYINLALLHDEKGLIKSSSRFTPSKYTGAQSFDGNNIFVLFSDKGYRMNMVRQAISWAIKASTGDYETEFPWGDPVENRTDLPKKNPKDKPVIKRQTKRQTYTTAFDNTISWKNYTYSEILSDNRRKNMASFISLLGAFNFDVCMEFSDMKLKSIFMLLVKRFAIVAETGKPGSGQLFFDYVNEIPSLGLDHEIFSYNVESLLVFGLLYDDLDKEKKKLARNLQIVGESSHFSRIMDVDDIWDKKIVGVADAGNQRMTRLIQNVVRYREDLGIQKFWPLPHRIVIDNLPDFQVPSCPVLQRKKYPYLSAVVSCSNPSDSKRILETLNVLVTQYPLEIAFALLEEWVLNKDMLDRFIRIVVVQIINDNGFKAKVVATKNTQAIIVKKDQVVLHELCDECNAEEEIFFGQKDAQQMYVVREYGLESKERIILIPDKVNFSKKDLVLFRKSQKSLLRKMISEKTEESINYGEIMANPVIHKPHSLFEWTPVYIKKELFSLIEKIKEIDPVRINIQYGHVHSDRDPGADQIIGSKIAGEIASELKKEGFFVESMPMIDNYHVVDRIDVSKWLSLLEKHSGMKTTEPNFESALITRHFGDEGIKNLMKVTPEKIMSIGGNVYLEEDMYCRIELYDGVGKDHEAPGRQGCVPFEVGLEIYRLNPTLASKMYREYILKKFPRSLLAKEWKDKPDTSFQQLVYDMIYKLPPKKRMELKKEVDAEIDLPYTEKIIESDILHINKIFEETNIEKTVLIHVMENFYNAQHAKFSVLWRACALPKLNLWRIGFNRYNGDIEVLDMDIDKKRYHSIVGTQVR